MRQRSVRITKRLLSTDAPDGQLERQRYQERRQPKVRAAHKRVICVRPRSVMPHAEWSEWFERRALMQGYTAVIECIVCEPGSPEARAALAKATQ